MDIAALATSVKNAQVGNQIDIAVARKTLDAQEQQGAAAIKLLQGAQELADQAGGKGGKPNAFGGSVDVRG